MSKGIETSPHVRMDIIELARARPPLSMVQISMEAGVSTSTVYRIVREAEANGELQTRADHIREVLEVREEVVARYVAGEPVIVLMEEYNISHSELHKILHDVGIPTRQEVAAAQKQLRIDEAIRMYQDDLPLWQISAKTGISSFVINQECHKRDIPLRRPRS